MWERKRNFHYCTEFEMIKEAFVYFYVNRMILIARVGVLLGKCLASPLEQLIEEEKKSQKYGI